MRHIAPNGIAGIPYGRSIVASLSDIVILGALIAIVARLSVCRLMVLSGLTAPLGAPLLVHGAIFGFASLVCFFVASVASDLAITDLAWLGFGGPITEEIVFRGLAVGALMRAAGWRFLPAALAPAIVFGAAHAAQGASFGDSAGIAAITGIGGLLFGWLYVQWGFNLWPAIFTHVGMNTLWTVFELGDTAIGGWFGNALRLAIVALVVMSAIWLAPRMAQTARQQE